MRTYLIKAPGPFLVATQDEARAQKREHGHAWEARELPDGKAAHLAAINLLLTEVAAARPTPAATIAPPVERESDHKPAFDQGKVEAMFSPTPPAAAQLDRDAICEAISDLGGTDLGFVALEVAARFESLAKRAPVKELAA